LWWLTEPGTREVPQSFANQTQSAATTTKQTKQMGAGWRYSSNPRSCRVVEKSGQRPSIGAPPHPTTTLESGGPREAGGAWSEVPRRLGKLIASRRGAMPQGAMMCCIHIQRYITHPSGNRSQAII